MQWECALGCLHPGVVGQGRSGEGKGEEISKQIRARLGPPPAAEVERTQHLLHADTSSLYSGFCWSCLRLTLLWECSFRGERRENPQYSPPGLQLCISENYLDLLLSCLLLTQLGLGGGCDSIGGRPGLLMSSWNVRMEGGLHAWCFQVGGLSCDSASQASGEVSFSNLFQLLSAIEVTRSPSHIQSFPSHLLSIHSLTESPALVSC